MNEVFEFANQIGVDASKQLTNQIAWFYARREADSSLTVYANALLTAKERNALPPPTGEQERLARNGPCKRRYLLEAQLYDTIYTYTQQFHMSNQDLPLSIRGNMNNRLRVFTEQTSRSINASLSSCFLRGNSVDQTAQTVKNIFEKAAKKLAKDIDLYYTRAGWYHQLKRWDENGYDTFSFDVIETGDTCDTCLELRGRIFTLQQIVDQNLYPPLHPNCRCQLLPTTFAAYATETSADDAWYTPLLRIPENAMEIAKYFCFAQQKRLQEGSLSGTLDWLTLGMVSGFVNGLNQRNQAFQQDPSFYNFINYMTIGAADVVKGAVAPDEPRHWNTAELALCGFYCYGSI